MLMLFILDTQYVLQYGNFRRPSYTSLSYYCSCVNTAATTWNCYI
jgi:hypothetical protein